MAQQMEQQEAIRNEALPWPGESVVECYLQFHPSFMYREQFVQLFSEAHRAYLVGCPRASIIVAGEALLRAIYDRIIELTATKREFDGKDIAEETLHGLTDELSFCQAIKILENHEVYPNDLIESMLVVKELRNRAAHGRLPLIDDWWDPEEPRDNESFKELISDPDFEFPEGYRLFVQVRKKAKEVTFDPRGYKCGSLKMRRELYPKHLKFFRVGKEHRERLFLAANRIGKTEGVGAYEVTSHLTGHYPEWWEGRRFDRPIKAWAAGDTSKTVRDIMQDKLLGPVGKFGTGMIPGDALMHTVPKHGVPDAVEIAYVRHTTGGNSVLGFKSYDQRREAFQGRSGSSSLTRK